MSDKDALHDENRCVSAYDGVYVTPFF